MWYGFDRVLEYMRTGVLSTEGLNRYDEDCVYNNLVYFKIPHKSRWDYSRASQIEDLNVTVRLQLHDGRICGADYNSICIYNMDTNIVEKIIEGHTKRINGIIQLEDGRLCSCSKDKTVRIWSKDSGLCELSVNAGTSISCIVQVRDGRICSGDNHYAGIKIWNITTGVCEIAKMTCNGQYDCIRAIVVIDGLRVCSCSNDNTIRILNVCTGVFERTLEEHDKSLNDMVLLFDGRLCSASCDGSMKIWTIEAGVCDLTVHTRFYLSKVIQLNDGRLVVSCACSLVCIIGV
jgi:WD40 repeat protein